MAVKDSILKTCYKCDEAKQLAAFSKDKRAKDGLQGLCRMCKAAYAAANSEHAKAYSAIWRAANQELIKAKRVSYHAANADKVKAKASAWTKANPERLKANRAAWVKANRVLSRAIKSAWEKANPEQNRACKDAWKKANPEALRLYDQNRRTRKLANGGKLSKGLATKLFALQEGNCFCCGQPLGVNYHLDHWIPIKLGGSNTDENIRLLTPLCNQQKGSRHPDDFMRDRRSATVAGDGVNSGL